MQTLQEELTVLRKEAARLAGLPGRAAPLRILEIRREMEKLGRSPRNSSSKTNT